MKHFQKNAVKLGLKHFPSYPKACGARFRSRKLSWQCLKNHFKSGKERLMTRITAQRAWSAQVLHRNCQRPRIARGQNQSYQRDTVVCFVLQN